MGAAGAAGGGPEGAAGAAGVEGMAGGRDAEVGETSQAGRLDCATAGIDPLELVPALEPSAAAARDRGARVFSRISRTLRSRSCRKDEYSESLERARVRNTTATMITPRTATTGPIQMAMRGADYARSNLM